jgi:hypothetical protein
MKTIITLLTTTMLLAGASTAMAADPQASDEAVDSALSWRMAPDIGGAYASVKTPRHLRGAYAAAPNADAGPIKLLDEGRQTPDSAKENEVFWRLARDAGLARAPRHMLWGAYGSAVVPRVHARSFNTADEDFQTQGGRN